MNNNTHAGQRPDLEDYYQGYRDVARANGLLMIDHYPNWLKLYDGEPDHATWKSYVPDGIHPSAIGAQRVILPEIQRAKNQAREPATKRLSENRLGEGDSPILLRGLREIGTVSGSFRIGRKSKSP